jgi:hypothetical protein
MRRLYGEDMATARSSSTSRTASRVLSGLAERLGARPHAARGPVATTPPIQEVAAAARRLHRLLETLPRGTSYVRATGVARAYDQVLATACLQLEVPTRLLELPEGKPRILERIRLEFVLGESGLII